MLLSVIVPFYGVEEYLPACLAGMEAFLSDDCEILLVDDCGTDGSFQIASTWAENKEKVKVIRRKQNGGLSAARNTGLDEATGEFVYFLDSDDIPEAENILSLAKFAEKNELDVAKGSFVYLDDETGSETEGPVLSQTGIIPGSRLFAEECRISVYEPMVWQCVYRRSFLTQTGLRMAENMLFEDELFQTPALLKAKRTAALRTVLLHYRQRQDSIMRSFSKNTRWCGYYLEICRRLTVLAKETSDQEAAAALKKRIAEIALSLGKNIPAYCLHGRVYDEAVYFLKKHKAEIANFIYSSGSFSLKLQGMLLQISPEMFMKFYKIIKR